jgi:hypothetical protein
MYMRLPEWIAHGNDVPVVCAISLQVVAQFADASTLTCDAVVRCGARMPPVLAVFRVNDWLL